MVLCDGAPEEVEDKRSRIAEHVDQGDQEATVPSAEGDREDAHRNVVRGRDREAEDKDRDRCGWDPERSRNRERRQAPEKQHAQAA